MSVFWRKATQKLALSIGFVIAGSSFFVQADTAALGQGRAEVAKDASRAAKSQSKIDATDNAYQALLQDYRATNGEIDQLQLYNKQMAAIVANQDAEIGKIDQQVREIEFTEQGILPLMSQMLDSLAQFNQLDLPFLQKERATRLAKLRDLMSRADITVSEKYRRVLEAYQIEVEYGRTLETYREKADDNVVYDYLRIGRTALYRLTLAGDAAWAWNKADSSWFALSTNVLRDVRKAQNVARQTAAPELLTLPLPLPLSMTLPVPVRSNGAL